MKKVFSLFFVLLLLASCNNNPNKAGAHSEIVTNNSREIEQLNWLLGTWTYQANGEYSEESWSKESETSFSAYSFVQRDHETVFAETMALEQKADSLFLTVATANQKNGEPVTFKMVSAENGHFTFENKKHDFPQRIVYSNPAADSLHAWIEGYVDGKLQKVDFYYLRNK